MARRLFFLRVPPRLILAIAIVTLHARADAQTRILVCEAATGSCTVPGTQPTQAWTFNSTEGVIDSVAGSHLTIDRLDDQLIVVRRTDGSGPTAGLTAVYSGRVHGASIDGSVEYTWPGKQGYPRHGTFAAQLQDQQAAVVSSTAATASDSLPHELLVCEDGTCNGAWILTGSAGTGTWFLRNPARATLSVLRFTPDDVRIRRTDTTDSITAIYTGRLKGDHYEGVIVWSSPDHAGDKTGHWSASVPQTHCEQAVHLDAASAMQVGQNALMFGRNEDAQGCYIVAAGDGDARAQTAVGLMYYQGRDTVPQDYAKALFWLRKAADQGVYNAQRTVAEMYKAGQGTRPDAALAEIYTARADEQKHDFERRQDLQEKAKDRNAQVLSSFVLGASFGIFF